MTTPTTAAPEAFVGIQAVADFLGISTKTIHRWIAGAEKFPVYRVGRQLRFRLTEIERWVSANRSTAKAKTARRKRA